MHTYNNLIEGWECDTDDNAIEYLTETYYQVDTVEQVKPLHSRLIATVEDGTLDIYYDYGADYYFCAVNEDQTSATN